MEQYLDWCRGNNLLHRDAVYITGTSSFAGKRSPEWQLVKLPEWESNKTYQHPEFKGIFAAYGFEDAKI